LGDLAVCSLRLILNSLSTLLYDLIEAILWKGSGLASPVSKVLVDACLGDRLS
jgi:hypothetical protein